MTAPRNSDNVNALVDGNVSVAPKGSTLPTTIAGALDAAFKNLGWITDAGISENVASDSNTRRGIDGSIVKTFKTNDDSTFTFECMEETAITLGIIHPGSVPVITAGVAKTDIKSYVGSDQRAWVIDEDYGTYQVRKVIKTAQAVLTGAVVSKPGDGKTLSFRLDVTADSARTKYTRFSNNPAEIA